MDRAGFRAWLQRYVDAWRLNALIESWLDDPDDPASWEADYEVLAVDGDVFVAHGRTRYLTDDRSAIDREFANVFVCRFDEDGRCREFTEYYMRRRPETSVEESVVD